MWGSLLSGRSHKILFIGSISAALTLFMITLYYVHIVSLEETPLERMRYTATVYTSAIAFFTLSLSTNLVALTAYKEPKFSILMGISTIAAFIAYIFPCERLIRFNYMESLYQTILIAVIHVTLLGLSALLSRKCYRGYAG